MYSSMKRLILDKHYKTLEDVLNRLNVFYGSRRLSQEQYSELVELANKIYMVIEEA